MTINNLLVAARKQASGNRLLVLGAGFTHAFFPHAPQQFGDYNILSNVLPRFDKFERAKNLLIAEMQRCEAAGYPNGFVNFERLVTRLSVGVPYDSETDKSIFDVLLQQILFQFEFILRRVYPEYEDSRLGPLARYLINNQVDIVTFNYDIALDYALSGASGDLAANPKRPASTLWNPMSGYGFPLRPVDEVLFPLSRTLATQTSMLLLKPHGSLNWHAPLGTTPPYALNEIYYNLENRWHGKSDEGEQQITRSFVRRQTQIIPPISTKQELFEQPIVKQIWQKSFELVERADEITFVGYSLPTTDFCTNQMLTEALTLRPNKPAITVVDFVPGSDGSARKKRRGIRDRYMEALQIKPRFVWDGAEAWATRYVSR